jgi:acetamidase/formamidase
MSPRVMLLLAVSFVGAAACAQNPPIRYTVDAELRATPQTVVWGYLPAGLPPALHIKSGQTVRIDTVSHQGIVNGKDPREFFAAAGIKAEDVLPDAVTIYQKAEHPKGASAHVLTGPIYIDGAEPGDMLEVRILDLQMRVPYGVNNSGPGSGVLPKLHAKASPKIIKFDMQRRVALFAPDIEVPLSPFMGIMVVAPPPTLSVVSTKPPGAYGGNMDFKQLAAGSTLYLPVYNKGAQFFTGDSHATQADGEVNGTAIEASLTPVLQFIVHKGAGRSMIWPRAEDATHYYIMGMDLDLDEALKQAVQETVKFLQQERGLSAADAYSLASIAVDFRVGEAVDNVLMVYGAIPKSIFKTKTEYWH